MKKCKTCKWFLRSKRENEEHMGECHFNAPRPIFNAQNDIAFFPKLADYNFCHEYEPAEENKDV